VMAALDPLLPVGQYYKSARVEEKLGLHTPPKLTQM
jgi:hypothetical protein